MTPVEEARQRHRRALAAGRARRAAQRPSTAPCESCGTPLPQNPGKRPRRFCGDACRKAAKRALARAGAAAVRKSGHLGKGLTEFSKSGEPLTDSDPKPQVAGGEREGGTPSQQRPATDVDRAAIRRYRGRKVLNRVSEIDACVGCGRRVLDPDTGVIYARSTRGYVITIGLVRCGRIWFCPECSSSIRRGRTEEIKTGALRWLAAGGTLAVVVLTARHNRTTELAALSDALWGAPMVDVRGRPVLDRSGKPRRTPGAYQRMLTAPAFYGRPEAVSRWTRKDGSVGESVRPAADGIRHRIGYAGMVRASEVTRSQANGWHPHMNLLAFLGGDLDGTPANGSVTGHFSPDAAALEKWEDWLRDLWASTLRKADPSFEPSTDCDIPDCKCKGTGHGVMIQLITAENAEVLLEYLTKVQDGKPDASVQADLDAVTGAAMETAYESGKTGKGRKTMTPFQILYRLHDLEVDGLSPRRAEGYGRPDQLRAWWAEYEAAMAGRRAIEWTRGLRRHVDLEGDDSDEANLEYVYDQDRNQELSGGVQITAEAAGKVVRADAELEMQDVVRAECYDSATDVVTAVGGRASHVRVLTAQEVQEVQEALFARLQARREESERQVRVAEWEADQAAFAREHRRLVGGLAQLLARRRTAPTSTLA